VKYRIYDKHDISRGVYEGSTASEAVAAYLKEQGYDAEVHSEHTVTSDKVARNEESFTCEAISPGSCQVAVLPQPTDEEAADE